MFVSNEPGYYEDGRFGIRLENVIRTVSASTKHNFNGKGFLRFEDVTLVPIQQRLIKPEMLTAVEVCILCKSIQSSEALQDSTKIAFIPKLFFR